MAKILAAQAAAAFEEIIGWPYSSPGTCDQRGIDCSGAWVRVYREHGKTIYHGSNTIYRQHCIAKGRITTAADLRVGMAVFKWRQDGQEPSQYQGDGIGNLYHIGCVTGVNPLRIVHATVPIAKADSAIGKWTHWGVLAEVDCGTGAESATPKPDATTTPAPAPAQAAPEPGQAMVATQSTGLRLRKKPDITGAPICEMPKGAIVAVLDTVPEWARVRYIDKRSTMHEGWCSSDYLQFG